MIEIVSLHILKTGGMSFLEMLKTQYGDKFVYRYTEKDSRFKKTRRKIVLNTLSSKTKVLHGHFVFKDVEHIVKKNSSKVIVWFRDPVERVISRYYFLMKRIEENPKHSKISFKNDSLLEFANRPSQINMMSRFVEGIDLVELFFYGFLETFEDDIRVLAEKLKWESYEIPHHNSNVEFKTQFKDQLSDEIRNELRNLNQKDVELYNRAWEYKNLK